MADILRVTSPLISKNTIQAEKAIKDPSVPFDLQEIRHVTKNPEGSGLLGQHNLIQKEAGAAVLMNLLKDPAVTVNYLKNIYLLEEIINLLPVNNTTLTQEIRQLFDALLINPEHIVEELVDQEYASTLFKGPLFDNLRILLESKPELKREVAGLLKAINGSISRQDVLDSVANSLEYLSEQLSGSKNLSSSFAALSLQARQVVDKEGFKALKEDVAAALKELENSVLFSPQAARVMPNILYNMSRYQDNENCLQEALLNLLVHVHSRESKDELRQLIRDYLEDFRQPEHEFNRSRIMDTLAAIINKQEKDTPMNSLNGEKIEKIITSLLSSPCNYTPLLHFVIPVDYEGMKAFSELWIDPREEGGAGQEEGKQKIHVLITFDIPGVGRMEAEFFTSGADMEFVLYCPAAYVSVFSSLETDFRKIMDAHGSRGEKVKIERMEGVRSLMDVFKTLPYKRTGVDVKV